jgi:enterochelin esterase-like enzyme
VSATRDVLSAQGAEVVRYEGFMGGHHASWWRGPVVEGLVALLGERR